MIGNRYLLVNCSFFQSPLILITGTIHPTSEEAGILCPHIHGGLIMVSEKELEKKAKEAQQNIDKMFMKAIKKTEEGGK